MNPKALLELSIDEKLDVTFEPEPKEVRKEKVTTEMGEVTLSLTKAGLLYIVSYQCGAEYIEPYVILSVYESLESALSKFEALKARA